MRKFLGMDLDRAFAFIMYDGEEGSAGAEAVTVIEGTVNQEIPDEVASEIAKNDPDFAKHMGIEAEPEKKEDKEEEPEEEPEENGDENKGDENATEGDEVEEGTESGDESSDDADEKKGVDSESETATSEDFEDDVIPGLKGEDLANIPEEAQNAIGEFYNSAEETKKALDSTQTELNSLMDDPIVKSRAKLISEGKSGLEYEIPSLSAKEIETLKEQTGMTDDDYKIFEKQINDLAVSRARAVTYNSLQGEKQQREVEDTMRKGHELLNSLGKFNKNLALPEGAKIADILQQREKHPQWEAWQNGLGKVHQWAVDNKMSYAQMLKYKPSSLYGLVGGELDMPVALNTGKRDKKMVGDAKRGALKAFKKTKGGGDEGTTLAPGKGGRADRPNSSIIEGGYDIVRLANDDNYREAAIAKNESSEDHRSKIFKLADKGRAYVNKKNKRK